MDFLNDKEKASIIAFTSNKSMFDAVKKVLLATTYQQGVLKPGVEIENKNWAFSIIKQGKDDTAIGQEFRAVIAGLAFIEEGFEKLEEFRPESVKKEKENPAV